MEYNLVTWQLGNLCLCLLVELNPHYILPTYFQVTHLSTHSIVESEAPIASISSVHYVVLAAWACMYVGLPT